MREMITQNTESLKISVRPSSAALFVVLLLGIATLMIFRQQCVREGYEISRLTARLDGQYLVYEKISADYYSVLRRENLINKAEDMGFVFPEGGRVFYVR